MLIPTDFSPPSQEAVDYGIQLAETLGSEIYLLHVYQEPLIVPSGPSVPMTPQVTEWLKDVQDQALKQLNVMAKEVEARLKPHSPPQSPQHSGESRRANINKLSSTRFDESLQLAGGVFQKVKPIFKVGIPFFEIVKTAEEIPADLIVMGTHGRTGLAHFMVGSVAELVVRKSPCPVLTVKPKGLGK
jgi:nucleotide-binding universal stress UspA family protein